MDIVANITRGVDARDLALPPGANEVGAEARLLQRAERVGNDEFAEAQARIRGSGGGRSPPSDPSTGRRARTRPAAPRRRPRSVRTRCRSARRLLGRRAPWPRARRADWRCFRPARPECRNPGCDSRRPARRGGKARRKPLAGELDETARSRTAPLRRSRPPRQTPHPFRARTLLVVSRLRRAAARPHGSPPRLSARANQ